jgi:porphobilinogen synthase
MLDLVHRPRRLRAHPAIRRLVRETRASVGDLIYPLFVSESVRDRVEVPSMPGVFQLSLGELRNEAQQVRELGIPAVLLFGIPAEKDEIASQAFAPNGIVQQAVRALKREVPELLLITDVCLCEYLSHGHCGVIEKIDGRYGIANDASVELLARTAISHAEAGADIVAPSDMMDGRVGAIRSALDSRGLMNIPVMSYASKFSSSFYGPFREAAQSAPRFGDRQSYQMDPANAAEALREVRLDLDEGADLLIVKPALSYLDILWRIKERFQRPTAVYNVSGEYAMVKAGAREGWLDEKRIVLEMMSSFRRAGADLIITYWAKDLARWLSNEE